jgi:hypothetical protein
MENINKSTVEFKNQNGSSAMPIQKLSQTKKDDEWKAQSVDAIIAMANHSRHHGRSSRYKKQVNYDLVNSVFDEEDFQYVLNPYGVSDTVGNSPGRLRDFNIIVNKLNTLKGEEIKRPFNIRVVAINADAINDRMEKKKEALLAGFQEEMALKLGTKQPELDPMGNPLPPKSTADIAQYYDQSYSDIREEMANKLLKYLVEKEKMALKFNLGFEHANIVAEEVYYVGIANGEPGVRVVNPLNFYWDKNPDLYTIEDSQWAMEERFMSVSQVVEEFGEHLTEDQVEQLDRGDLGGNRTSKGMQPGFIYNGQEVSAFMRTGNENYDSGFSSGSESYISVINTVWKSMRKIGFLTYLDDNGEKEMTMVGEDFVVPKGAFYDKDTRSYNWETNVLEWRWINEVWKGTKIGNSFYVDVNPLPNQCRSQENLYDCKLPYVGRVYNSLNSVATSLVDLMKPHQYLYNIIWYRLEAELAKAKGKAAIMDLAMLPKSHGMSMEQWMYYLDNVGIMYINSKEEGREGDPSSTSSFNQFKEIDRTLSNNVVNYIQILNKLEEMVGNICGINRQREGQASASETATGVQANLAMSANITEHIFYIHNEVKKQVLTQLLEAAKIAYIDGKKTQYVLNDLHRSMLTVDGEMLNEWDYGVFVSNSQKDAQIIDQLQALAQAALQGDKIDFSDLVKIYKSNSIAEITNILEKGEDEKRAREEQMQQQQLQSNQQIAQQQIQSQKDIADREDMRNRDDNETKVQVAEIGAMGFAKDTDINQNNVPDVLEIQKLQQKSQADIMKIKSDQVKVDKELADRESQRKHETQMQSKEIKLKQEELKKKEKIEKYKVKHKPKPSKKK